MAIIPATREPQAGYEFKASLGYKRDPISKK
jgi:hypothetical protein